MQNVSDDCFCKESYVALAYALFLITYVLSNVSRARG